MVFSPCRERVTGLVRVTPEAAHLILQDAKQKGVDIEHGLAETLATHGIFIKRVLCLEQRVLKRLQFAYTVLEASAAEQNSMLQVYVCANHWGQ